MKLSLSFPGCYATIIYVIFESSWVAVSKGLEDMVHEALHAGWGIGRTKGHHSWGIKSSGCFKCHKVFSFVAVSNIPIAVAWVKFAKEYHSSHSFNDSDDAGEGEDVFYCDGVNFSVIEYGTIAPVLLSDVEDGCRVWGFRFLD